MVIENQPLLKQCVKLGLQSYGMQIFATSFQRITNLSIFVIFHNTQNIAILQLHVDLDLSGKLFLLYKSLKSVISLITKMETSFYSNSNITDLSE